MARGARLNVKFMLNRKFKKCNKCPVCEKALRSRNKTGLCSADYSRENLLNRRHQSRDK